MSRSFPHHLVSYTDSVFVPLSLANQLVEGFADQGTLIARLVVQVAEDMQKGLLWKCENIEDIHQVDDSVFCF